MVERLQTALLSINPDLPLCAIEDAVARITRAESPSLFENNRRFHKFLTDGVDVEYQAKGRTVYDALEVNDSAVMELGDDTLKAIASELVRSIRRNVTIDWTVKESVRAKLRVTVRRLLKKYGYPPDKQEQATQTVLQQAELLCKDWAI